MRKLIEGRDFSACKWERVAALANQRAAAVSKNLQEELARAEDMIRHYLGSGYLPRMSAEEAREWLKEITALREKP